MTETLVETPSQPLLRVSIYPLSNEIKVQDSRIGYVSWRIETLIGSFVPDPDLTFLDKNRCVEFRDMNSHVSEYVIKTEGNGVAAVAVTVNLDQENEKSYFLNFGNSPLEIL